MEPSSDEAAETLRRIDRQRREVREQAAPPIWAGCAVFTVALVAIGLVEDLAAPSSGVVVMSLLLAGLVVGLAGRTRRGAALLGRRSLTRPRIVGAGAAGRTRSRIAVGVIGLAVTVAVAAATVWLFDETATPVRGHHTVLNLGAALVGSILYVGYRRWSASRAGRR